MSPASTTLGLPSDFLWGFATASYQIEGATEDDGRADSIWDVFCRIPGKIRGGHDGSVACDSYHRYRDDVALLKSLGARAYRFSISWSRVVPLGGRGDPVNEKGLQYYSDLVDALLAEGIEPMVTLLHWDVPAELDRRYAGLLNKEEFSADFERYAGVVFEKLGNRVKYWVTFNEPWCSAQLGYGFGVFAPGHTSRRDKSAVGDSGVEPWIVGHTLLLAHGKAVKLFREQYKQKNGGEIGIVLNGDYAYPWDPNDPEDVKGAQRKLEFTIGWFLDPIYHGDYPASMRAQLGDRLPQFTESERALIKGSNDYYGMNHYCAHYIRHKTDAPAHDDHLGNVESLPTNYRGEYVGPETESDWLWPNPEGFRHLLKWISDRTGGATIYVTENGTSIKGENELPLEQILDDDFRLDFYKGYLRAMAESYTLDKVNVRGYMAWSLMDNFEWADGYSCRFGTTYVDYENGQKRIPKKSAKQLQSVFEQYIGKV